MFKSVDHHNPTLEWTMVKRKMWGLLSYSLRKHNSHSIQSNPQDSDVSCDWQDVADLRFTLNCRDHNFTTCRPFRQHFLPGLWQAVCYLNSKFASFAQIWQLLATESRNKIMSEISIHGWLLLYSSVVHSFILIITSKPKLHYINRLCGRHHVDNYVAITCIFWKEGKKKVFIWEK